MGEELLLSSMRVHSEHLETLDALGWQPQYDTFTAYAESLVEDNQQLFSMHCWAISEKVIFMRQVYVYQFLLAFGVNGGPTTAASELENWDLRQGFDVGLSAQVIEGSFTLGSSNMIGMMLIVTNSILVQKH